MRKEVIFFALTVILFSQYSFGQNPDSLLVTENYYNEPLVHIIKEFESNYDCHFYYIDQQLENVNITVSIIEQPIEKAIELIINKTPLNYYLNSNGGYVIYKGTSQQNIKPVRTFTLTGIISDLLLKETLPFVNVFILEIQKGSITNSKGYFKMTQIPEGNYTIRFSFIGYITKEIKLNLISDTSLNISLSRNTFELEEVVITPGLYEIKNSEYSTRAISKKEILYAPNLVKDIARTFRALPGLANNDFSAKPRIRGGNPDENAFYLDNFEISEPFHFEEFDGLFSVINTDYVNSIKVMPGGFSVKFQDKLSGIIDIKTSDYISSNRVNFSFDLLNLTFNLQRKISDKTNIFLSARRTYLDLLFSNASEDIKIDPVCYDVRMKISHTLNAKNQLSFNLLYASDQGNADITESFYNWINIKGNKRNYYSWVNWRNIKNEKADFLTTLGYQKLSRRSEFTFHNSISPDNPDNRITDIFLVRNNSRYKIAERFHLEFGGEVKLSNTGYEFKEIRYNQYESTIDKVQIDTIDVNTRFFDNHSSLFVQNTYLASEYFSITAGVRFSHFSYLKNPILVSPRVAVAYSVSDNLNCMIGYGIFNQADNIKNMKIYEGQDKPLDGFNQSHHYTGSITYRYKNSDVLLNFYYKNNNKLSDDYRYDVYNRLGGAISILDETFTTVSGYSKGIESTYKLKYGKNILSVSYIYAVNKIRDINGEETYRNNDRKHTVILNNLLNLKNNWSIGTYFLFYSGEPYSPSNVSFVGISSDNTKKVLFYNVGSKNSERLPAFSSLDFKIDKVIYFKKLELNIYMNIVNLFSHENIRNYYWYPYENYQGELYTSLYSEKYLSSIFVSPGMSISF